MCIRDRLITSFSITAQTEQVPEAATARTETATRNVNERFFDGTESLEGRPVRKSAHQIYLEQGAQTNGLNQEEYIGTTYFDLQSNGSGQNRVQASDALNIGAVWTHHPETDEPSFPIRGTGHNETINMENFFPDDDLRLEENSPTGWPNLARLADGTDIVVNHLPGAINELVILRRTQGTIQWVESTIPSTAPFGLLWPQIAVSGNTIHLIAATTPPQNGGGTYLGLNPALLYFRSLDGGITWDILDRHCLLYTSDAADE